MDPEIGILMPVLIAFIVSFAFIWLGMLLFALVYSAWPLFLVIAVLVYLHRQKRCIRT